MNGPLVLKTVRDNALLFAITAIAVVLFEILLVLAMRSLGPELLAFVARRAFLQNIFRMLLSLDLRGGTSVSMLVVLGFVHPFLFATTWGFMIAIGTRVTVGEIDDGTADLLLSLPISRASVYVSTSVVWIAAAALLSLLAWLGLWLGTLIFPMRGSVEMGRMGIAAVNLFALYMAIGGTTSLVSCLLNRRGVAVAILIAILLFSFLINFLAVFVAFFQTISFLGLLDYYRPAGIRSRRHLADPQSADPGNDRGRRLEPGSDRLPPKGHSRGVSRHDPSPRNPGIPAFGGLSQRLDCLSLRGDWGRFRLKGC